MAIAIRRTEPSREDLQRCVHCGYCLADCPTYVELGSEAESPRGRLHLIDARWSEGRASATPELLAHLDRCIQCRACETACPSDVPFGRIMERGRAMALGSGQRPAELATASVHRRPLASPSRPSSLCRAERCASTSVRGCSTSCAGTGILRLLPGQLQEMEQFLPSLPDAVPPPSAALRPSANACASRRPA